MYDKYHPYARMRLTQDQVSRFLFAARRKRDLNGLFTDIIHWLSVREGQSLRISDEEHFGIAAEIDTSALLLGAVPAKTEDELFEKMSIFQNFRLCVEAHGNLPIMLQASIDADLKRIKPARLPAFVKIKH